MNEKKYLIELGKLPGSRKNEVIRAVNQKVAKKKFALKGETEEMFFDRLMNEAAAHEKKYGKWPVFDMGEIESDDPVLDVYSKPVK